MINGVATGVCTWWPVLPVLELGELDTPATGIASLSFEVSTGFTAFTLVLEDFADRVPVVTRLVSPDGTVFISAQSRLVDAGQSPDFARCSSAPGTATVLVPQSDDPRAVVTSGRWQMEIAVFERGGFPLMPVQTAAHLDRIAVVLKRASEGGLIDLEVQLAPETGYQVDGGTYLAGTLARVDELLRDKLGIALGQVHLQFLPVDAGVVVDSNASARALFSAQSFDRPASRPINVMIVDSLTFAGGIAGLTPGPPGVYARPSSGVIVAPLASGPTSTGVLLGHELGHFLGLPHTSDSFFGPDLISDTPACADPSVAGCGDERNLMFPFFPTREPLSVTAGQAKVLAGSPWVYRQVHPTSCGTHEVIGLNAVGFSSGTTLGAESSLSGTCGGSGGERVHLIRLEAAATTLTAVVTANGFQPVLSVRRGECSMETTCARPDAGTTVSLSVDAPTAGAYFVVVDSVADGGTFTLEVSITP